MTSAQLHQWIQHPECLDRESLYELRTLVARYPYFQSLRLLYLKNLFLLHDDSFGSELRKAVLYVADRRSLFYLIEGDRYALQRESDGGPICQSDGSEEPGVDRTLFLIDAFLSTMPAEQNESSGLDYAMDYTAYLLKEETNAEQQENVPKLRGQDLIDGFLNRMDNNGQTDDLPQAVVEDTFVDSIAASDEEEQKDMNVEPVCDVMSDSGNDLEEEASSETSTFSSEDLDDSCFTETLAKIYIKQHRYEKALEIIKKLSLNYPKKNAYFADQIRFLEKLIINAKTK